MRVIRGTIDGDPLFFFDGAYYDVVGDIGGNCESAAGDSFCDCDDRTGDCSCVFARSGLASLGGWFRVGVVGWGCRGGSVVNTDGYVAAL